MSRIQRTVGRAGCRRRFALGPRAPHPAIGTVREAALLESRREERTVDAIFNTVDFSVVGFKRESKSNFVNRAQRELCTGCGGHRYDGCAVLRAGSRLDDIQDVVKVAATTLEPDLKEASSFVCLFHASLDMDTGVHCIDAGRALSLVRADASSRLMATSGRPLGAEVEQERIEESVQSGYGDSLVSVSDGVLDLFDGTLGALGKVAEIVRASVSAQAAVDHIMSQAGPVGTR
ncbi:SpoIIE family protein phosphatase [Cryobacterium sp. Y50]|uniref:SpoIIE family protein phosphatase n=1 Tax=Cryobacterium sp. Y50 TaxID=2048286 RepID=UPI001304FF3F|nr:SpoIIE family protein phosphatase [Cryobacterium sp. Y50]